MAEKVGIFREMQQMQLAVNKIADLKVRYQHLRPINHNRIFNLDLVRAYELEKMLDIADIIARGALVREESRGSHYRTDCRNRDDEQWLKHTIAHYTPEGPRFSYRKVEITQWEPEARKY